MTVLLSYFPSGEKRIGIPRNGVELLSDHIYKEISRIFPDEEVIYLNFQDREAIRKLRGLRIKYFFGISSGFNRIVRLLKPEISCLIAVNEHALMRRMIRDYSRSRNLSKSSHDPHDGYESNIFETCGADFVLGIGSWSVLQSFRQVGFPLERIFITGYPYWQETHLHKIGKHSKRILMFPGYICTRKGADLIHSIVAFLHDFHPEFCLKLVGFVAYSDWGSRINEIRNRYPNNFEFSEGKIDYGSHEWRGLADGVAFALFPSHEEGIAGCALDVLNLGVALVHSSKVGIEFQHPSLSAVNFDSEEWKQGLTRIIDGGPTLWKEIAVSQRRAAFHLEQTYSGLAHGIERISGGRLWPNIDFRNFRSMAEQLSFLNDTKVSFDYFLGNGSTSTNHIDLEYLGLHLSDTDSLLMSILILEKYTNFDSLSLNLTSGITLNLIRVEQMRNVKKLGTIQLQIPEYFPSGHREKLSRFRILFIFLRELLMTFTNQSHYRIKRLFNIMVQKAKIEFHSLIGSGGDNL